MAKFAAVAVQNRGQAKYGPKPFGRGRGRSRRAQAQLDQEKRLDRELRKVIQAEPAAQFRWVEPCAVKIDAKWGNARGSGMLRAMNEMFCRIYDAARIPRAPREPQGLSYGYLDPYAAPVDKRDGCQCGICRALHPVTVRYDHPRFANTAQVADFEAESAARLERKRLGVQLGRDYDHPKQATEDQVEAWNEGERLWSKVRWWRQFLAHNAKHLGSGSSRHAYLYHGVVIKIPTDRKYLDHNRQEAYRYQVYRSGIAIRGVPVAQCRMLDEVALVMEKVQPGGGYSGGTPKTPEAMRALDKESPAWLRHVDNDQAGLTAKGDLVAFDCSAYEPREGAKDAYGLPIFYWGDIRNAW